MGKKYSKQAWISREGPEGDCVVENDATNLTLNLVEEPKEKGSCTADFTYKGYPVNVLQDGPCGSEKAFCKKYAYYDYPIEVVELPEEPDGKKLEVVFEREGQVEASTQTTRPVTALSECGQSVKSIGSDRQEWSYTLYDFEGQGHVTRDDLKSLVKSIYEVLGKSMSRPKSAQKDPVKKLCVRLSLSKERSRDAADMGRPECLLTTNNLQEHPKKSKAKRCAAVEREGSMTVHPPSTDFLNQVRPQSSLGEPTHPDHRGRSGVHHRRSSSCKRCEQRQPIEKDCPKNGTRRAFNPVDSKGMYHYPRRMQTGPGECNPPSSNSNEMARVKEWINQWSHTYDKHDDEPTEEHQRHKHKHRHRVCQGDSCEVGCGLRRCPQYLDLATDHLTYPYHTGSQSFAFGDTSPRPQRHRKHSEHTHCKHNCCRDSDIYHHDGQPVIHRHEHHHHHSHHHYHHYVS